MPHRIYYSDKYYDANDYEYRHVILPKDIAKTISKNNLLAEAEWRAIGVQQSRGWVHYAIHRPEPHILLMRRPRTDGKNFAKDQNTAG
jgi:cyclin-dependent kinase regulatory subunit CKS1